RRRPRILPDVLASAHPRAARAAHACARLLRTRSLSRQPRQAALRRRALSLSPHTMTDSYTPRPEHHFTFGLWTVGNPGRDPFGDAVRPPITPPCIVEKLGPLG